MRNLPGIVVSVRKGMSLRHLFFYGAKGIDWGRRTITGIVEL
jgi:hypothetical protein